MRNPENEDTLLWGRFRLEVGGRLGSVLNHSRVSDEKGNKHTSPKREHSIPRFSQCRPAHPHWWDNHEDGTGRNEMRWGPLD